MSCGDEIKTLLSRYVDGELSPGERTRVDEHVAGCTPCRELLQIFQKNESLLSNALSTESFGNTVIENVINEIKREGVPAEAKAVEEAPEPGRFRPVLQLAAAALLIAGLIGVLSGSHNREMSSLQSQIKAMAVSQQEQVARLSAQQEEYNETIRRMRTADAMQRAPEGWGLGYMTPQHLVIRASFDPKLYGSFCVYRHAEGEKDDRFAKINNGRLDSPEYIDASVKPGQGYVYKFRAYPSAQRDEVFVESLPIVMRVPRVQEFAPEKGIRVQCVDIAVTHKLGKFLLNRVIDGATVTEEFLVKPGERLGDIRDVPGVGQVDFRTNLVLERLEDGNQTLAVRFTRALMDANGQPIVERVGPDGKVEVKTEQQDGVLSIRPNLRAFFRISGAATADVDLWKGSWIQVRAAE